MRGSAGGDRNGWLHAARRKLFMHLSATGPAHACCSPPPPHLTPAAQPPLFHHAGSEEEIEDAVVDEELEAEETVAEIVADADIDPAVAAENARLVDQFKERMKVGGVDVVPVWTRWCSSAHCGMDGSPALGACAARRAACAALPPVLAPCCCDHFSSHLLGLILCSP